MWLKNNYKQLILFVFIWSILMGFFLFKMPYSIYLPGGIESAQDFVQIENANPSKGTLNLTYVSVISKPSPLQYFLAKLNNRAEFYKMGTPEYHAPDYDAIKTDQLDKLSSIDNAIIAAYKTAGKTLIYHEDGLVIERK